MASVRVCPLPTEYGAVCFPPYGVWVVTLAHQGGWDEILLVIGPILLIIGVLAVAKRRVDRLDHHADDDH